MPYLSASAVVIHYEEALYQVYAPLTGIALPTMSWNIGPLNEDDDNYTLLLLLLLVPLLFITDVPDF